jgi:hypothetical protein
LILGLVWAHHHRRTLGGMTSLAHDALSWLRRPNRDWRVDLVYGVVVGLIAGVLDTLETGGSIWRSILVWVPCMVAAALVGGWIRRRRAFGAHS